MKSSYDAIKDDEFVKIFSRRNDQNCKVQAFYESSKVKLLPNIKAPFGYN